MFRLMCILHVKDHWTTLITRINEIPSISMIHWVTVKSRSSLQTKTSSASQHTKKRVPILSCTARHMSTQHTHGFFVLFVLWSRSFHSPPRMTNVERTGASEHTAHNTTRHENWDNRNSPNFEMPHQQKTHAHTHELAHSCRTRKHARRIDAMRHDCGRRTHGAALGVFSFDGYSCGIRVRSRGSNDEAIARARRSSPEIIGQRVGIGSAEIPRYYVDLVLDTEETTMVTKSIFNWTYIDFKRPPTKLHFDHLGIPFNFWWQYNITFIARPEQILNNLYEPET